MKLAAENRTKLMKELERDEGRRLKLYRCTAGKQTIGIGRNIEDRGISNDEADLMLSNDIDHCVQDLETLFEDDWHYWEPARQRAVINLLFNMGLSTFKTFVRTIACIQRGEWGPAADALLKSKYATQVGNRAKRVADQLRNGGE